MSDEKGADREPLTSFERLHLANLRLFVVALYRPILRPSLRFLDALSHVWYGWRRNYWTLREVVAMWRATGNGEAFFAATAERRYDEATYWYCVNGCCTVIWGRGKRGNMGGYGPAGCSCDELPDPRDLARGPISEFGKEGSHE